MSEAVEIRPAVMDDFPTLWPILKETFRTGESYPMDPDISRSEARHLWMELPSATYLAEQEGRCLGTYYLKPNQAFLGAHVCNAGYMVAAHARRRGIARRLCQHSIDEARRLGFLAMQFNLVVSTNTGALRLWQQMGFEIVGTLPRAFRHPRQGLVDAHVMYQWIAV
ncbi:MAG: GNAT family N-acetyltransferase [Magnetococcales bacterium]|nr:GNAT family N-acetyltransferase [Magnetococcales bacterium]